MPFLFAGFLPRKKAARRRRIEELGALHATFVIFESPHRIAAGLRDLADVLGDRAAVVARELTKIHEEVVRGSLGELARAAEERAWKGEIAIVVAGTPAGEDRGGSEPSLDPGHP